MIQIQKIGSSILVAVAMAVVAALVTISVSLFSFAQNANYVVLQDIKQPTVKLKDKNVSLQFPIFLNNTATEEQEAGVELNCVKSVSSSVFKTKKGKKKYTYIHPLSREEVLALNDLKKRKGSFACTFSLADSRDNSISFDLYRNRVRLDIKNVKKK